MCKYKTIPTFMGECIAVPSPTGHYTFDEAKKLLQHMGKYENIYNIKATQIKPVQPETFNFIVFALSKLRPILVCKTLSNKDYKNILKRIKLLNQCILYND